MPKQLLSVDAAADQLRALGVPPGQLLQVHTAFSIVGPLDGDPLGLIEALRAALSGGGTLVMPSMTDDHCCERFALVDEWLDERTLQRRGSVGHGEARLVPARAVVDVVVERLRVDETAFLHLLGTDAECDDAWASLRQ